MIFFPVRVIITLAMLSAAWSFLSCSSMQRLGPAVTEGKVTFRLKYPEARSVYLIGSFNNWDTEKNALSRDNKGLWSITITLYEGRYEYLFLIDKEKWLPDPYAPAVDDGFGGKNSVLYIRK